MYGTRGRKHLPRTSSSDSHNDGRLIFRMDQFLAFLKLKKTRHPIAAFLPKNSTVPYGTFLHNDHLHTVIGIKLVLYHLFCNIFAICTDSYVI